MIGDTEQLPRIPEGARLVEAYETATEIVVMGDPPDEDENGDSTHSCDHMGCGFEHVIYRLRKPMTPP